jgi:hypothetical protein
MEAPVRPWQGLPRSAPGPGPVPPRIHP